VCQLLVNENYATIVRIQMQNNQIKRSTQTHNKAAQRESNESKKKGSM